MGRVLKESPYLVALVASSSWSHAFLTAKSNYLWPDTPSGREMPADLKQGSYAAWSRCATAQLEDGGQHELLNWACLLEGYGGAGWQAQLRRVRGNRRAHIQQVLCHVQD